MEQQPQVESSANVFAGRVFDVRTDVVRFADGAEQRLDIVEHPGSIAIIATPSPDEIVLVRQYRHPARAYLWELPAGTAEPDEEPAAGALRELREETGYRAARLRALGTTFMSPGICDEVMYLFHADGLTPGEQSLDPDERIEAAVFSREAAWRLVAAGQICDVKTVLALLWMQSTRGEIGSVFGR